jgi:hypothetical protein
MWLDQLIAASFTTVQHMSGPTEAIAPRLIKLSEWNVPARYGRAEPARPPKRCTTLSLKGSGDGHQQTGDACKGAGRKRSRLPTKATGEAD